MAPSTLKPGVPITLQELEPSSEMFKQGASLRVTGILQSYDVDSAVVVIQDGSARLKIDTQNLRDISFRSNSTFQFIGELLIQPNNDVIFFSFQILPVGLVLVSLEQCYIKFGACVLQAILQARVGRNVDGLDLNLYQQSLIIRRQHEAKLLSSRRP
ncbi:hypothetical protein CFC21_016832 [Triticum aestivum]|uniref:FHA domain-containing protein n=3 Tax=Triticum TaxID=4564 RepID=A0A9R1NSZ0_TRITD|nr:hypothetical protein CFC21_016832 [Triticum aestivum]VAH30556.1 unnamed protein product [Triticum turgidum subsp. durum]